MSNPAIPSPQIKNHILKSLPVEDYGRLLQHLEQVELRHGHILNESGGQIEHVYFPEGSMVSLISSASKGQSVETGIVGYEGMVGISVILGVEKSPYECLVQVPDGAMRLKSQDLLDEFRRGGALQALLLRYTQGLLLQTAQIAVCNGLHPVSERLARWLLMSNDRCVCEDLPFTQEFLSLMLGVRRAGVSEAAITLQATGFIHYQRGHIQILDRAGLEDHACACYRIVKAEFDLLVA